MLTTTSAASIAALTAGCRIASRGLSPVQTRSNLIQCQQVRFARKTFALKYRYGLRPLYTDHLYNEAVEQNRLDDLSYQQIRFNLLWETNSPLQDDVVERYLRYMQRDGRRYLLYELLHKTFYEIKTIQYKRFKKLEAKKAASSANSQEKDTQKKTALDTGDEESLELNPVQLFHMAVDNCKPYVITTRIKRGGAVYQVPTPVRRGESEWLAMKWLNDLVKERPKPRVRHYHEELAQEIIDAANNRGKVVKKKDDMHKLAQANKAYSHYRWG
uniref:28S ribosomal protein S7, mitochondrial n=1 Tax=Aceria tosichella TaxID=561515 RepID=A0A6G1S5L5_9ACAR